MATAHPICCTPPLEPIITVAAHGRGIGRRVHPDLHPSADTQAEAVGDWVTRDLRRPVACRPRPLGHTPSQHDPPGDTPMERLLLVEHNLSFREGLALLLGGRTGWRKVRAGSLAEAKAILEEANHKPACVVVDLELLEGEGTEVLEVLDGLPMLVLIGSRNLQREIRALGSGAEKVLRKTEAAEKIAAAMERLVGR